MYLQLIEILIELEKITQQLKKAIDDSVVGDTIVIFGSFVVVGPVLDWLRNRKLTGYS